MKKKRFIPAGQVAALTLTLLIAVCIIALSVLIIKSYLIKKSPVSSLSDLGGVFSSTFEDMDLSIEISGRLSEGLQGEDMLISSISLQDNILDEQVSGNLEYSNKLLSWGISRNAHNKTPDADPGAPELLARYNGLYLGDIEKKEIYLTFDEGYENGYTPKILDVLKENKVKAIFFITGPYLNKHQDLVRRMVEEGHIVGNHTIHHPSLPTLTDEKVEEEVLGLERAFKEKFNKGMSFLRPPKGEYSERTLAITNKLGYINMFWSFAYDDWYVDRIRGKEYAYKKVMDNLHNGAILLLHAVSKDNAEALDMIIKGAIEKGYAFGDVKKLEKGANQD